MRERIRAAIPVAVALLATACVSERPVIIEGADIPLPTTTIATTTTSEIIKPPTTTAGQALGLITPTGVVVPVLEDRTTSYLVRTPCGNEAELVFGTPIGDVDVVLDPGHGGAIETGAVGPNGLAEKDLNLDVAKRVAAVLRQRGISVALTRTSDYRVPLAVRSEIGDTLKAEALVSLHHNAPILSNSDTPGSEVFIQQDAPESQRLGTLIYEEVVAALSTVEGVKWVSARDAGAILVLNRDGRESYGMIRRPETAAVLAEMGYLANPTEAEFFASEEYLALIGPALANAIERFITTDQEGTGYVTEPRRFTPSGATGGSSGCTDPALE